MTKFIYVLNAGRSGSTYLYSLIASNFSNDVHCLHEAIAVQDSLPRIHNRAYADEYYDAAIQHAPIRQYLEKVEKLLETRDVIETGWTAFHLLPVFSRWFGDRFSYGILHRNPVLVALSRSILGCYHPKSWYNNTHEVSPFDKYSVCTKKADQWENMNYVEKSLFFWFVVHLEADEFAFRCYPPLFEFSSDELFDRDRQQELFGYLGLTNKEIQRTKADKNPVSNWALETFAVRNEWQSIFEHQDILDYAERRFGYNISKDFVSSKVENYQLSRGVSPAIRYYTQYWRWRRRAGQLIRNCGNNSNGV